MLVLLSATAVNGALLRCGLGALIAACIAVPGFAWRALTWSGLVATVSLGALAYGFGNLPLAAALVIFFLSGSILSRIGGEHVKQAREKSAKGSRRDAAQVLANGGVALACAGASFAAQLHGSALAGPLLLSALGAVAAASGDTWSTEIGTLSRRTPLSIITLRPVDAGSSGGITLPGTLAAPLGGLVVGLAALPFSAEAARVVLTVGLVSGLLGSLVDSALGASVQGLWHCGACGLTTESAQHSCAVRGHLVRGVAWLDNDAVNVIATFAGGLVGFASGLALH